MTEKIKKQITGKKKGILIAIIIALAVAGVVVGALIYQHGVELDKMNAINMQLTAWQDEFNSESNDKIRLVIIKDAEAKYNDEKKFLSKFKDFDETYGNALNEFKDYFKQKHEKTLSDNTIHSVDEAARQNLQNAIDALNDLKAQINAEDYAVVYGEDEISALNTKIDALITSYTEKAKSIDDATVKSWNDTIAANTLDVAVADKDALNSAINNLNGLTAQIDENQNSFIDTETVAGTKAQINDLTASYTARLDEIAQEEEAQRQAEEEAAKANKKSSGSGSSKSSGDGNSSNSGSNSSSSSSSSSSGHGSWESINFKDENGNIIEGSGTKYYEDGWVEYEDGRPGHWIDQDWTEW